MEEPIIEAIALTKNFGQKNQYSVLKNINLKIYKGEFIAITGASGSGKSTLLNLLSGLEKPTSGEILYNGDNISNFSDSARSNFRNKTIGFVFQSYNLQPFYQFTITSQSQPISKIYQNRRSELKSISS